MEVDRNETGWRIRMTGEATVTCAGELKQALIGGLASGGDLHLDLSRVEAIDISILQLLWLAGREAKRDGVPFELSASAVVVAAMSEAGIDGIAGVGAGSRDGEGSTHG